MKKILKIGAYVLGGIVLLMLGLISYLSLAPLPTYAVPASLPEPRIALTPERIAQGQKIAAIVCQDCHLGDDGRLSGKFLPEIPAAFGKFYAKNITNDATYGIGGWTDGELYYFLRTGLRRDGSLALVMPSLARVSDEDLTALVAYLRSDAPQVQASTNTVPPNEPSLLGRALAHFVFRPGEVPPQAIPRPDTTNAVAWGRYLANDLYDCYSCHSASFTSNDVKVPERSKGFYGGGNELVGDEGQPIYSSNLTAHATGIGHYSEDEFVETLRFGRRPDGQPPLRYPMMPRPGLTDAECRAIYTYLRSLPPIDNTIPDK